MSSTPRALISAVSDPPFLQLNMNIYYHKLTHTHNKHAQKPGTVDGRSAEYYRVSVNVPEVTGRATVPKQTKQIHKHFTVSFACFQQDERGTLWYLTQWVTNISLTHRTGRKILTRTNNHNQTGLACGLLLKPVRSRVRRFREHAKTDPQTRRFGKICVCFFCFYRGR